MKHPSVSGTKLDGVGPWVWIGCFCLILWTRFPSPWILAIASALVLGAAVRRRRSWRDGISVVVLAAGVLAGFAAQATDRRFIEGWEGAWERKQERIAGRLEAEFDALVSRGDLAVLRVSKAASSNLPRSVLQDSLLTLLEESGLTSAAVFGPDGRLSVWAGSHHGRIPAQVLNGSSRHAFSGAPLFSYLYFVAKIPDGGGTAVVNSLMDSDLPEPFASGLGDFASRLREQTGERIGIAPADRVTGTRIFDFGWPGETLMSVTVEESSRAERRGKYRRLWTRLVVALAALTWLLQFVGTSRRELPYSLAGPTLAAAVLPLDVVLPGSGLVGSTTFLLPGPVPLSLGRILLLCWAATPFLVLAASSRNPGTGWVTAPLAVAVGFPLVLHWFRSGASTELLGTSEGQWIAFTFSLVTILTLLLGAGLSWSGRLRSPGIPALIVLGVAAAAFLGLGTSAGIRTGPHVSLARAALWALPTFLIVRGLPAGSRRLSYIRWLCAFWLAGTAVLPFTWSMRTEARMAIAEAQMGRLGIADEPYLDSLLFRFADQAGSLDLGGANDVEILYQAWISSGLADAAAPVFLTLWSSDGAPQQELRLGVKGERPSVVGEMLPSLQIAGVRRYYRLEEVDVSHLIFFPLSEGRLVTATIPPRRTITPPSAMVPLFALVQEVDDQEFLTLARTQEDVSSPGVRSVQWSRNEEGWMGESVVPYPDGLYAVFYTISIPKLSVMLARGTLLLAMSLVALSAFWLMSVGVLGGVLPSSVDWRGFFQSFRARVTWTLFGFFVLSSALFGTLAYRTLSGASERTATALAERVVAQIAEAYQEEGGSMESLARRVGADLLEYRNGELAGGSVNELVELGLYETWVDPAIYEALETRHQLRASRVASLGDWRYVVAYRRLPDGDIVASPVPLRAGAAALRRRDVADLLALAVVLGPVLSLVLALFVGRALTRPIDTLQVASERVGSGNLAVHLPEDRVDEFGSVFAAFNRMVLRLGDARRELLQTTRRTKAIVEEAATGVIALDRTGRITVANPQAESLLATSLEVGAAIPGAKTCADKLAGWLDDIGKSGAVESAADFEWGDRRIRVRARRISQEGHPGGVVVNLEDVTDELRSERILAWGEMAQQVAHEVKNPLTPMKLSVQHLLRAWTDRRGDFDRILKRNVGAILKEIDRLASIARSFSRLASPGTAGEEGPVVSVDVATVVQEILNLYRGGGKGPIRLKSDLPPGPVLAMCRRDEIKEVLLNLLENARAAMSEGGAVRICARNEGGPEPRVAIMVEDEGTGIPAELLPRIFEPQFSTYSTGTGLGLAIVKRLVDSWGGFVEVESEVGRGTRVRLRLRTG